MFRLACICAVLALAAAAPAPGLIAPLAATPLLTPGLSATLLPRVAVAPATTTIVKQPIVVDHPTPVLRSVPVPVRAVSYAAPSVIAAPSVLASPWAAAPLASPWAAAPLASPWAASSIIGAPLTSSLLLK